MKIEMTVLSLVLVCVGAASAQSSSGSAGLSAGGPRILPSNGMREREVDDLKRSAGLAASKGDLDEAERYYRQAYKLIPMNDIQFDLAKILVRKNLKSEALDILREITMKDKEDLVAKDPVVLAFYGELALSKGKLIDEAYAAFSRAAQFGRDSLGDGFPSTTELLNKGEVRTVALLASGFKLSITGQDDLALPVYEQAVKVRPRSDEARFYYAWALSRVGRAKDAQAEYKKIANSENPLIRVEVSKRLWR